MQKGRSGISVLVLGVLILAAAGVQSRAAWRLYKEIGTLELARQFAFLLAGGASAPAAAADRPDHKEQAPSSLLEWLAVSETTRRVWLGGTWFCAALLALPGAWMIGRGRVAWRLVLVGAVATILAGAGTVAAGLVLVHYAAYPLLPIRTYALAFALHSAPGWILLGYWAGGRRSRPAAVGRAAFGGQARSDDEA